MKNYPLWKSIVVIFVICTGTSNTHVAAITNSIKKNVSKTLKEKPYSMEGIENQEWVLMDYVDVVVHIFLKNVREFYDIENLWGDAKISEIKIKAQVMARKKKTNTPKNNFYWIYASIIFLIISLSFVGGDKGLQR